MKQAHLMATYYMTLYNILEKQNYRNDFRECGGGRDGKAERIFRVIIL
jgi:hypothetical protein